MLLNYKKYIFTDDYFNGKHCFRGYCKDGQEMICFDN